MPLNFKIWNQGNDGRTMGIRVEDVKELAALAGVCTEPDTAGTYASLQDYLDAAAVAHGATPQHYSRHVDVVWLNPIAYGGRRLFPGRRLLATYTGNERQSGGFASQCYCVVDEDGYAALAPHHKTVIEGEYIAHAQGDVIVLLP